MKRYFSVTIRLSALSIVMLLAMLSSAQQAEQPQWVTTVAWGNVKTFLALGWSDGTLEIVDSTTQQSIWTGSAHKTALSTISWSLDDNRIVTGDFDGHVTIWSSSGEIIAQTHLTEEPIAALQWLIQDKTILVGLAGFSSIDTILIIDANNASIVNRLTQTGAHFQFSLSPSHNKIASRGVYDFTLFNAYSGERDQIILSQQSDESKVELRALAWSDDDSLIGTARSDGIITLWNLTSASQVEREWRSNLSAPYELNIDSTETGITVEVISADGTFAVYAVDVDVELIETYSYPSEQIQHFSPYRGHLVQITRAENLNDLASRDSSDVWSIIVAPASLTRIQSIARACRRDAPNAAAAEAVLSTPAVDALTNTAIPAFVNRVNAMPEGVIPPACKADLLAVANALVNPQ